MAELREITSVELKEILEQHQKWVKSTGKEGKQANLHKVNLRGGRLGPGLPGESRLTPG